jgi:hypothetical protein
MTVVRVNMDEERNFPAAFNEMSQTELRRRMPPSEIRHRMALVRTDVSEERLASIIRMKRIIELRTTLAVSISSSETSICTRATWRHIPQDSILHSRPWPSVRKRTIPIERPPLVGEF